MIPQASALIFDSEHKTWLRFDRPVSVLSTFDLNNIREVIEVVDRDAKADRLWAVGWVSYEAAPAFDPSLPVRPDSTLPKVWFATFREPTRISSLEKNCDPLHITWSPTVEAAEYTTLINKVKAYIRSGDTYQVNFSLRLTSQDTFAPERLFSSMVQAQAGAYSAFIETDDFTIASASPELLFVKKGSSLTCKPMKGTSKRGRDIAEDKILSERLRTCEKNRAENIMIVDMARNDLSKIAEPGTVQVPDLCSIEIYPHILQMTSTVTCATRASIYEILKALFPAASITGAPKRETMRIISELESTPRNIYTGSIGVISPDDRAWFNVAIRTALFSHTQKTAEYGIGSGIVWDSTPEHEYEECLAKASAVTVATPPHELFETMLWEPQAGLFLQKEHLERLERSALYFGWSFDRRAAESLFTQITRELQASKTDLRVKVYASPNGALRYESSAIPLLSPRYRVSLAKDPVSSSEIALYHKTTNRRVYERAEPSVTESDDTILWNERGEITETKIANILVLNDGVLYTPPVECGLLSGCYRRHLLEQGAVKERVITIRDLLRAEKIVLCNSLRREWGVELVFANEEERAF